MRTAGIVILEGTSQFAAPNSFGDGEVGSLLNQSGSPLSLRHFATLAILGDSVLNRVVNRLARYSVVPVTVFCESENSSTDVCVPVEQTLHEYAEQNIKAVVIVRLGAYAEVDFSDLLRFHRETRQTVTWVHDVQGPLQISVFDLAQSCWTDLLRDAWGTRRLMTARYFFNGYVNRLETAHDFRRLTQDALTRRCDLRPVGREMRPGVWMGDGARVDSRARILAPAYVGAGSRVHADALITRGSTIEHNCRVDCSTIVEDSNVLPGSYLGPGLALAHSLVEGSRLLQLSRNLELELHDQRLLGPLQVPAFPLGFRLFPSRPPLLSGLGRASAPTESSEAASVYTAGD